MDKGLSKTKENVFNKIARAIAITVEDPEKNADQARAMVKELTDRYPLYE